MGVENLERVVDLAEEFRAPENIHRDPGDGAGAQAEEDGAPAGDHTRGGGDGDEACDHALHGADDGRFLEEDHVHGDPAEEAHGGADIGVQHGNTGIGARCVWIPAVEAVPPGPEDPGSDEHERDVAGFGVHAVGSQTGANPPCTDNARCAGGEMDDIAAGIVDDAHLEEEAAAPDAECPDAVGKGQPEGHEDHPGGEIHPTEV